jgi:PAS domain S-box-containing protein
MKMKSFRNSSIQRKLAAVILATSCLALALACAGFALYQRASVRAAMISELSALADTLGANAAASLMFSDRKSALDMLRALGGETHIIAACLYDNQGKIFTEYRRPELAHSFEMPAWAGDGAQFDSEHLRLSRNVSVAGTKAGSITIISDLGLLHIAYRQYVRISALVLLISIFLAFVVSAQLLRVITSPILELARIAGRVSIQKNYSLRAVPRGSDEVGTLVSSFNQMLEDIQQRDAALQSAQLELEQRVDERTAELAERGELVKTLLDSTPGAMYGMDADGVCTFCNPAGVRTLGYADLSEILGKPIHDLIHHTRLDGSTYPKEESPIFLGFRDGKDAHVLEDIFWRKDGTHFSVEYSSRQIRREDKLVGAVVTFLDITERKRHEMELHQSQKLEAVGRLAAGIAHEINTPIQFISDNTRFLITSFSDEVKLIRKYEQLQQAATLGAVDAALLAEISATRTEIDWLYLEEEIPLALDQMLDGLGRVSTIVRGMKEFSHVDRSNEKAPGDINRAIESTLIVGRNELKYVADVETHFGQLPPVVCHLGDLNQVFLNLLVNAAHAIQESVKDTHTKGKICVSTRVDGDWAEISISDSGTGIPEEARNKVFDPFFTTKGVGKGTGQGLALARSVIVDRHGGTLHFVTEMGKGTTFYIRLPLCGAVVREEALA